MKYIAAVDQSTSSSKAFLVDERGEIVRRAARAHRLYYPAPGRVEQDAEEILRNVEAIIAEVTADLPAGAVRALALTNQRETSVLWERATGRPVCPAIVWQDTRGGALCAELAAHDAKVRAKTGSDLSPYLPASKLGALLRENPELRRRAEAGDLCMGTIESYLIFRLCGRHASDYSNASRTQLLDIGARRWDGELFALFGVPMALAAGELLPSDACFGEYRGMPVTGVLGDSFGTLFGQGCHAPGTAKVSYGTGTSVMVNVGNSPAILDCGLTTAIAWGWRGDFAYEIEGNITCSGDTLVWLKDGLELFASQDEIERLAGSVPDSQGVQLVPAMAGLGAPFFDVNARAVLCGMSRGTTRAHIARAALDSMAQRVADVFEVVRRESGFPPRCLMVDGGGSKNELLMQIQADLADCELRCSAASEFSALGAGYMAGLAVGVYADFDSIPARQAAYRVYRPQMDATTRAQLREDWARAILCARL